MSRGWILFCIIAATFISQKGTTDSLPVELVKSIPVTQTGDGSPVAYPSNKPDGFVLAFPGRVIRVNGKGEVLFDKEIGLGDRNGNFGTYHFDPSVIDLDGDGTDEIIAGCYQSVFALNGSDGSVRWEFDLGTAQGMFHYAVTADLDHDGKPEILCPNTKGWMYCLNPDGTLRWRQKTEPQQISIAAIGDIDHDGMDEVVYGTETSHLVALNHNGTLLWDTIINGLHLGRTQPQLADVDGDGSVEVFSMSAIRAHNSGLICVNGKDGSIRWHGEMLHKAYCGLAVVDLDRDGTMEILAGDKSTALACFSADGSLRWRTFMNGRGIFGRMAVGDVDGDGSIDIVQQVRDQSPDGFSWYLLNADGKIIGSYKQDGGCFGTPLIADIDDDGKTEVVIAGRSKPVVSINRFGGDFNKDNIPVSDWSEGAELPESNNLLSAESLPEISIAKNVAEGRFGQNPVQVHSQFANGNHAVEVITTMPDASVNIETFHSHKNEKPGWIAAIPGNYQIELRLWNRQKNELTGSQAFTQALNEPFLPIKKQLDGRIEWLREQKTALIKEHPKFASAIAYQIFRTEERFSEIANDYHKITQMNCVERDKQIDAVEGFLSRLEDTHRFAELVLTAAAQKQGAPFVLWQDRNPWDNVNPITQLDQIDTNSTARLWMLGNETESVVVNLLNLGGNPLTLRIEPGSGKHVESNKPVVMKEAVRLHRVVWVPSRFDETVADMLPALDSSYLITVAPGEVQQLWLNVSSQSLDAGQYQFEWDFRTFDQESTSQKLHLSVDVSKTRLPDKSRYAANFWSQNELGDINTIPDLNRHGQNVWYRISLPQAQADEDGTIVGELDWKKHDSIISRAEEVKMILYSSGAPVPRFPGGTEVTDELKLKAQRNYIQKVLEHLKQFNLDYRHFCFYPEDEPGLTGGVESYIEKAKAIKAVDPRLQVYANPFGMITVDMIREMEPYTDVWQPGIGTVELLGDEYVNAMKGPNGNKPVWMYTPPGNTRIVRPIGFFRAMAWQAYAWGISGGGYWVYHSDDLWATKPELEPAYGVVAYDGRTLVTSRRWEATRDGIEDYNLIALVTDALKDKQNPELQNLLNGAVLYMTGNANNSVTDEQVDEEPDFTVLQDYRMKLGQLLDLQ